MQEINFMKQLGYNEHIVSLMGCITLDSPLTLLTEYCALGDLLHYLRTFNFKHDHERSEHAATGDVPSLRELLSFAWQICDGMVYLTYKGYIHRDLAARNVFVTETKAAKIGDFGLCRHMGGEIYTTKGGRVPIKWLALESLKFYEYSSKSDVWSFGVVLYEIFSLGNVPYPETQPADILAHLSDGNRLEQPEGCPENIYEIMRSCWLASALHRPSFEELLEKLRELLTTSTEQYGYLEIQTDQTTENQEQQSESSLPADTGNLQLTGQTETENSGGSAEVDYEKY